jgi:hypothetical protein
MGRKDTGAYDIYLREENGKTVVAVISSSSSNCTCSTDYETHLSRSHHLAKKIFSLSLSLSPRNSNNWRVVLPAKEEEKRNHQIKKEK